MHSMVTWTQGASPCLSVRAILPSSCTFSKSCLCHCWQLCSSTSTSKSTRTLMPIADSTSSSSRTVLPMTSLLVVLLWRFIQLTSSCCRSLLQSWHSDLQESVTSYWRFSTWSWCLCIAELQAPSLFQWHHSFTWRYWATVFSFYSTIRGKIIKAKTFCSCFLPFSLVQLLLWYPFLLIFSPYQTLSWRRAGILSTSISCPPIDWMMHK